MLAKFLKTKLRFTFNPLIRYFANNIGNYQGVNTSSREIPVIISLTSSAEHFEELVIFLYSLLNQKFKPDRIILWLSDEYDLNSLPYEITRYMKNGLEIRFVKDIYSYTKVIYALKDFSDSIIVTADDDIYYPKNWLKSLYYSYILNPDDIHVHRAYRVEAGDGKILLHKETFVKEESARFDNFLVGTGGVLFPPKCFSSEVLREDVFLKYAPYTEDVWLWVMALINNRKIRVVKKHIKNLTCVNIFKSWFKFYKLSDVLDEQLSRLMNLYGSNVLKNLNQPNK